MRGQAKYQLLTRDLVIPKLKGAASPTPLWPLDIGRIGRFNVLIIEVLLAKKGPQLRVQVCPNNLIAKIRGARISPQLPCDIALSFFLGNKRWIALIILAIGIIVRKAVVRVQ